MPNIEGLSEWTKRFPDRIFHSRQYRRPEPFSNQTVLVVGAQVRAISIRMNKKGFPLIRFTTAQRSGNFPRYYYSCSPSVSIYSRE
jgi:cation diffusion facilitator CzcD-associated flavoprotein CzcO